MVKPIAPAPDTARYVVRGRDPAMIEATIGLALPRRIGESKDGVAMLGPDEWLALLPTGKALETGAGQPLAVVDVSDRQVGFIVQGPRAIEILSAGCPLDLERWPVGRASRTIFELVEVVIVREESDRFRIEVWRSFAPWLEAVLEKAANNLTVAAA